MPRKKDNEIYSYKLKSGKTRYGFKTYIGIEEATGKSIKVSRQGFATYKDAEQEKMRLKVDGADRVVNKRNAQKREKTVNDVWKIYSESYRLTVRGSTYRHATIVWGSQIAPEFGDNYINHISVDHVQQFANKLARKYVAYSATLNQLRRVIKFAQRRGWAEKDPFDKVVIPRKSLKQSRNNEENFYSKEEVAEFLAAAKNYKLMAYTFFVTLVNLGLRRGEGLALKWSDFDFDKKIVHIQRTVTLDEYGKTTLGPVKNDAGNRFLTVSNSLMDALDTYREAEEPLISEFVFHKPNSPDYYTDYEADNWIRKIFSDNPSLKRITPHGLRHTLATLLYDGDDRITPKDVQYMLGHSKPDMALDIYTHITKKQRQNISSSINNLDFK
ncbi:MULTISPECIES: site-specific integrase [Lactobacillus]|uniref:Site-specific integrase n=1 Tax=Lactobacillus xujianguonis TaxID=2495899 RepID=A0A437SSG4_9LACO|nr:MULTISPECIES: site-specific integrase [Lactobacillus]RVU69792.1 site-specific integrase [Lactobacillus xujianguonis]